VPGEIYFYGLSSWISTRQTNEKHIAQKPANRKQMKNILHKSRPIASRHLSLSDHVTMWIVGAKMPKLFMAGIKTFLILPGANVMISKNIFTQNGNFYSNHSYVG
jgi:hypothetical protein